MGEGLTQGGGDRHLEVEDLDADRYIENRFHTFKSGATLELATRPDNTVALTLCKGDDSLDLASLLPPDWTIGNYFYCFDRYFASGKETHRPGWGCDPEERLVQIGFVEQTPVWLLWALHEIGHAVIDAEDRLGINQHKAEVRLEERRARASHDTTSTIHQTKEDARLKSKDERAAWAHALSTFRMLARRFAIAPQEIFESTDQLRAQIDAFLRTQRKPYDWVWKSGHDAAFEHELDSLFGTEKPAARVQDLPTDTG